MMKYYRVIAAIHLLVFFMISGCASAPSWTKQDFKNYANSHANAGTFPLKLYGNEVNLKMGMCCTAYLDSRYSSDALPVRDIKAYMENKYGVKIDISEFENHRVKGDLNVITTENERGEKKIKLNEKYVSLDGLSFYNGLLVSGSWAILTWSDYKEPIDLMSINKKFELGRSDQLQIYITTNVMGPKADIWLRIKEGTPDKDGYYKLKAVAHEKVSLPFKAKGCNIKEMAEAIKTIPDLLRAKDSTP